MTRDHQHRTSSHFTIGDRYTKEDIYKLLEVPIERRHGAWDTGYREYEGDCFIFANVGVPGRTGHDYANTWVANAAGGEDLEWQGKTGSTVQHPLTQQLLQPTGETLIFWRSDDRAPFTFAGAALPDKCRNTVPVGVTWRFPEGGRQLVEEQALSVLSQARAAAPGQGIRIGSEEARAIETRAMILAVDYFTSDGWMVEDVCRYRPYDLHCTSRSGVVLHVEVKGTKTDGVTILLTPNEVEFARAHVDAMALYVVSRIETTFAESVWTAIGGVPRLVQPWCPEPADLVPIGFSYRMPERS